MDASRFDRLSKALAGTNTRRTLVQAATALGIVGVAALQDDAAAAKRHGRGSGVSAEHWRHKKKWYCLDGESIRRYRRKQELLLSMGATLGKCSKVPPCVPTTCAALGFVCGPASDGCGGTLACGTCTNVEAPDCCAGQCVSLDFDAENCGTCGNVCEIDEFCVLGFCSPG